MEITVNYDYREDDVRAQIDVEALAAFVIEHEGKPAYTEVSINFVTDQAIHELNREYRGIDRPTDVLSFECDGAGEFAESPEQQIYELGDIVVAPDVAQAQCAQFGTTFSDELHLLVTHGLLHLCGYDHMEDSEAEAMEQRERDLLGEYLGRPFER